MKFGTHLMLDIYDSNKEVLSSSEVLRLLLDQLVHDLSMHKICDTTVVEVGPKNQKDSGGISAYVMIAESHISIHTFPNRRFASMDIYTCQDTVDVPAVLEIVKTHLNCEDIDAAVHERGTRYPSQDFEP